MAQIPDGSPAAGWTRDAGSGSSHFSAILGSQVQKRRQPRCRCRKEGLYTLIMHLLTPFLPLVLYMKQANHLFSSSNF